MYQQSFIFGYLALYFIFMFLTLVKLDYDMQGVIKYFKCVCGKYIYFNHNSVVKCPNCPAKYEITTRKHRLIPRLLPSEEYDVFECNDCHKEFYVPKNFDGFIKCPFCPRRYYARNMSKMFVKPLPRKKWW